jgi:hypothetical protein
LRLYNKGMHKRLNIMVVLSLSMLFLGGLWYPLQALAQAAQQSRFTIQQLALLAIAPPPENAGILDLFQLPVVPDAPKVIVAIPGYPLSAAWSPDGSLLALIMIIGQPGSDAPPSDIDIYTIDRQGASLVKVTHTPTCPEIGLAWQADSSALYFTGFCRDSQATTFWRLDAHTGAAEELGEVQWDGTWAVWSPDASKIALLAPRKAEDEPCTMNCTWFPRMDRWRRVWLRMCIQGTSFNNPPYWPGRLRVNGWLM